MLFNSAAFILGFLPIAWIVFFALGTRGYFRQAVVWLTAASLFFYGWWNPLYVPLLMGSMAGNYFLGRRLSRNQSRPLLLAGVALNLLLLGYYKYAGFLVQTANDVSGAAFPVPEIALPLAMSFFTFQQIAFLIDAYDGVAEETSFANYSMFITFFPHLIAGPITHHKEMLPQFDDSSIFRPQPQMIALGLTLFVIGLCKKVLLADTAAQWVTPVFEGAASGSPPVLTEAWLAALSYALQIYFDFSGYTDMAIGIGMLFGIRLPRNFNSPYKARNIIEFWSRWHMTLTRFLTAYLYNPVALHLTRARLQKGKPGLKRGKTSPAAFLQLVAVPTVLTMFLAGLWHGAGWQFIAFGVLHGMYLTVNHAWRTFKASRGWRMDSPRFLPRAIAVLTTFLCVIVALVFFRAANVPTAVSILSGMLGQHGAVLPDILARLPGFWRTATMLGFEFAPGPPLSQLALIAVFLLIIWTLPNSQEWLGRFETAFGSSVKDAGSRWRGPLSWQPTTAFGVIVGVAGFFAILRALSAAPTEFLYFQF